MATCATTSSSRTRSCEVGALEQGGYSSGQPASRRKGAATEASAGAFSRLDDDTARIVLSCLPFTCLGDCALVSKAWEALSSKDDLWRPFFSEVDPMAALGQDRLQAISLQYSCKQAVSELSARLCSCCREPTNGFFVLTCTRLCQSCFETDPSVTMCSLSFARSHYLLSKSQERELPTFRVQNAKAMGRVATDVSTMTVTLVNAAKASATSRWGSEEAFQNEMSTRRVKAEASYEARKQAFDHQTRGPASAASAESSPPNGEGRGEHQGAEKPRRFPSRPRILGLDNQTNSVGVNQQAHKVVTGEKYGFFTVVSDAFFDGGPTVVIKEDTAGSYYYHSECWRGEDCGECEGCFFREIDIERAMEERHGWTLAEALKTVKHGTTIKVAASCYALTNDLILDTSVRLIGTRYQHIRTWDTPLVIRAPSIVRDLKVRHWPPPRREDVIDYDLDGGCENAVTLLGDALLERCRIGEYGSPGVSLLVEQGRLVANGNTFLNDQGGVVVDPRSSKATTVHLEGNTFESTDCGLHKGPDFCHRTQDDDAILAANTFDLFSSGKSIRECDE